jgi:hypothetical protein
MAGNVHLSPNAYSSGFDSDDSENSPIITFTQEVRNLPPKRIPKKKKKHDDEDEGPFKGKRAPLKDKNDKAARHPEKTQRSPRKGKFGASPKPKKVKKVKKKLVPTAHDENADVGDENGGGAAGNYSNHENTNSNDASCTNTVRRDSLHCFEVVEHEVDFPDCFTGWNDPAAGTIRAVAPAEIAANDDPLVDVLLAPLLEDDGVAPQPVGPTCTMAPAAHEGVAPAARAQLPRAPPLAAQAAPHATLGWFSPPHFSRDVARCGHLLFVFAVAGRRPCLASSLRSPLRAEQASGALASRRGTRARRAPWVVLAAAVEQGRSRAPRWSSSLALLPSGRRSSSSSRAFSTAAAPCGTSERRACIATGDARATLAVGAGCVEREYFDRQNNNI